MVETLKKEKTSVRVQAVRQSLARVDQRMKEHLPGNAGSSFIVPKAGDRVEIDDLGTVGVLQEDLEGKKQVSIRVGSHIIKIAPSAVRVASSSPFRPSPQTRRDSSISSSNLTASFPQAGVYQHEYDLRGIRLEDALEATIAALDQALMAQSHYIKIIHGQGSGALKAGIRNLCQSSPYTKSFRAGDPAEGGDGVTIIELK
jgi:DNA mismatch repair protein MutS2